VRASLQGIPIFAGLSEEALDLLLAKALDITAAAGEAVVTEGQVGNRFYVITEGTVRVCKDDGHGAKVELARLGPKEFFGEMCMLETLPRSASVQAVGAARLLSLSSFDFLRLYNQMPDQYGILVLNLARDLSRRLRHLDEVFAARH
jgi:CRP/FNR family transcriptional regulator, cyclic AMP receptor protein